jgi:hypothetical protein
MFRVIIIGVEANESLCFAQWGVKCTRFFGLKVVTVLLYSVHLHIVRKSFRRQVKSVLRGVRLIEVFASGLEAEAWWQNLSMLRHQEVG